MTELKSFLPPADEVIEQQSITITHIKLDDFQYNRVTTRFGITNAYTNKSDALEADVYCIDADHIRGYIPSKTWYDECGDDIRMLFYTSPTLPPAVRPFGDKPCYVFLLPIEDGESIEYHIDTKILIDQLMINGHMCYMFMFAADQMKNVLTTQWDGTPWSIDVPEAVTYMEAV